MNVDAQGVALHGHDPVAYFTQQRAVPGGVQAVSRNYTVDIDPNAFTVVNGKLYVNYSMAVQERWRADRDGNITKAGGNWPGLLAQVPPKKPTGR